jgi:hypothetical protein
VQVVLHIDKANFRQFFISQIFNITCAYKPDLTIQQELEEVLKEKLGPEDFKWALEETTGFRIGNGLAAMVSSTRPALINPNSDSIRTAT